MAITSGLICCLLTLIAVLLAPAGGATSAPGSSMADCHVEKYLNSGLLNCSMWVVPGSSSPPSSACCNAISTQLILTPASSSPNKDNNIQELCSQAQCLSKMAPSLVGLKELLSLPRKCGLCYAAGLPALRSATCAGQHLC